MSRTVKKWVGKTDDTPAPPRVRVRVFERYKGICQITGRRIRAGDDWDLDHEIALINGGKNDEDNLRPVLRDAHKIKTADDLAKKSKIRRVRMKHLGVWPKSKAKINGRGFPKTRDI